MLSQSLLLWISTLAAVSASPLLRRCPDLAETTAVDAVSATRAAAPSTGTVAAAATPSMPQTGAATELPSPSGTLARIAVGHGIQNYTCSAAGATGTSSGALAVLYDITSIYSSLSTEQLNQLPIDVADNTDLPLNLAANGTSEYAADPANPFKPDADLVLPSLPEPAKVLGHHFFDQALTPTFDLYGADLLFAGGKLNGVKAPSTANAGPLNTGAVDWVQLGDKGASRGVAQVYRVVTAGGNPQACTSAGQTFSIPYATQYWFYSA